MITALPVETVAVRHVLGGMAPVPARHDPNRYATVTLACGTVVSTLLVATGNAAAADACAHLVHSFPSVRTVVMCGIALGVPRPGDPEHDLRLGDVAVGSAGVVHYSHRRVTDGGSDLRGDTLVASPTLMRGVNEIRAAQHLGRRPWQRWLDAPPFASYRRPGPHTDPLPARPGSAEVFYGRIGSGDELLRSASRRDEIARTGDLLAIEMEGAGVAVSAALGGRECLVIRGISDYGDAEKSDLWQPYASLAAAAYLRAVLEALGEGRAGSRPSRPMDLVGLMERVPSLQTPADRDVVLNLLGPPISVRVARDARTRVALLHLVKICEEYPSGFRDLVAVLVDLEGADSTPVSELAAALGGSAADHS
ncbi:hypothetical protein [Nonomuraea sp. NPDC046570]|uniref:effector-associated domain 2-containing protein n=1 Tax=Nonomuraea sp. NPDC046570 TaxID=3155255 RepID=UPI00340C5B88